MTQYTKEQKIKYFSDLRSKWKRNKALAENDNDARAIFNEAKLGKVSYFSFYFTLLSMKNQGLSGLPYVDCKTFAGWKDSGFKVKKGEKSKINGITWIHPKSTNDAGEIEENEDFAYPKLYHLFHKTQVNSFN